MKTVWITMMNKARQVRLTNPCQGQCQEQRSPPKEHRVENPKSHSSKRYLYFDTEFNCWYHVNGYTFTLQSAWLSDY